MPGSAAHTPHSPRKLGYRLSLLEQLEAESIYVLRETAAAFEKPVMLYTAGKDSSVMVHLARKAFYPGKIPFPLLNIDTSFKFREMSEFRDRLARELGVKLVVYQPREALARGMQPWDWGTRKCCAELKTRALLDALAHGEYDAAIGGARREEERSRAKERVFSIRDQHGQWDPRTQRPELWNLYNTQLGKGETMRVFPLSNWTELDVWLYIHTQAISVPSLYFAKEYEVIERDGRLFFPDGPMPLNDGETPRKVRCRFRTLGCYPCTGAVRSDADSIEKIIGELLRARQSERHTRIIDYDADGSMEDKKKEGYF